MYTVEQAQHLQELSEALRDKTRSLKEVKAIAGKEYPELGIHKGRTTREVAYNVLNNNAEKAYRLYEKGEAKESQSTTVAINKAENGHSTVIAYLRVSTDGQTTDSQRHTIENRYRVSKWFTDEATSGVIKAKERQGFSDLLKYAREGDTVIVSAVDRLGRDTIDVLETVELLKAEGVTVVSVREGFDLSTPVGKAMLTMLSAVAELERSNIKARQMAGIEKARAAGKIIGRVKTINDSEVCQWRTNNKASIKQTAEQFSISIASVKRACRKQ